MERGKGWYISQLTFINFISSLLWTIMSATYLCVHDLHRNQNFNTKIIVWASRKGWLVCRKAKVVIFLLLSVEMVFQPLGQKLVFCYHLEKWFCNLLGLVGELCKINKLQNVNRVSCYRLLKKRAGSSEENIVQRKKTTIYEFTKSKTY